MLFHDVDNLRVRLDDGNASSLHIDDKKFLTSKFKKSIFSVYFHHLEYSQILY